MAKYKRILLAVDFVSSNDDLIEKAVDVVHDNDAELLLVHVNEPIVATYDAGGMTGWSNQVATLDEQIRAFAEDKMSRLADRLGVPSDNCFLPYGKASSEIKRLAEEQDVDLIVMGTHGRHGLGLLLGSTANAVLHGVGCDVLAVRTPE